MTANSQIYESFAVLLVFVMIFPRIDCTLCIIVDLCHGEIVSFCIVNTHR